jgi:hypothetical protein
VLEPGSELDLAEEARDPAGSAHLGSDELDRNRAAVAEILRQIDRRHPSGAELALNGIAFAERGSQALQGIAPR